MEKQLLSMKLHVIQVIPFTIELTEAESKRLKINEGDDKRRTISTIVDANIQNSFLNKLICGCEKKHSGVWSIQNFNKKPCVVECRLDTDSHVQVLTTDEYTSIKNSACDLSVLPNDTKRGFLHCCMKIDPDVYKRYSDYLLFIGVPGQIIDIILSVSYEQNLDTLIHSVKRILNGYAQFMNKDVIANKCVTAKPTVFATSKINEWWFSDELELTDQSIYIDPAISTMFHCDPDKEDTKFVLFI